MVPGRPSFPPSALPGHVRGKIRSGRSPVPWQGAARLFHGPRLRRRAWQDQRPTTQTLREHLSIRLRALSDVALLQARAAFPSYLQCGILFSGAVIAYRHERACESPGTTEPGLSLFALGRAPARSRRDRSTAVIRREGKSGSIK